MVRGRAAVADGRGAGLRPRLDLRPPRLGRSPRLAVVRHDADPDGRRARRPPGSASAPSSARRTSGIPRSFWRDVQSLDDLSGGRFLLGVGNGADLDAGILGGPALTPRERVDRFQEFTRLLLQMREDDHVTSQGRWFSANDMRTLPRVRHVPLLLAANGPRSVRFAARHGDGWMTTGPRGAESVDAWFDGVGDSVTTLDEALTSAGRDPACVPPLPQPRLRAHRTRCPTRRPSGPTSAGRPSWGSPTSSATGPGRRPRTPAGSRPWKPLPPS